MVDEGFFGTIETQYPSLHWDLFVVSKESESSLWKCLRSQNFLISKATYASRREKFWPDPWLCFFLLFWYCAWSQDRFVQKICEDLKKRISFESAQHQINSSQSCRSSSSKKMVFQIHTKELWRLVKSSTVRHHKSKCCARKAGKKTPFALQWFCVQEKIPPKENREK